MQCGDEAAKILAKVQLSRRDLEVLEHKMKNLLESEDHQQQLEAVKQFG